MFSMDMQAAEGIGAAIMPSVVPGWQIFPPQPKLALEWKNRAMINMYDAATTSDNLQQYWEVVEEIGTVDSETVGAFVGASIDEYQVDNPLYLFASVAREQGDERGGEGGSKGGDDGKGSEDGRVQRMLKCNVCEDYVEVGREQMGRCT